MKPNFQKLHELCRLRSTLEAFAVERLRGHSRRDSILRKLRQLLRQMLAAAKAGNHPGFHQIDVRFHRELVRAGGLGALAKSWKIVMAELDHWLRHVKQAYWANLMSLHREHELLLEAFDSGREWAPGQALHQHLEEGWFRLASSQGKAPEESDPVDRACAFISTHFATRFRFDDVARQVSFVSTGHLNRLFRQKLGISPHALLKRTRLERGAELLVSGGEEIFRIAGKVGYQNASHFIRDFRRHYRTTPGQYRQNGGRDADARRK